MPARTSNIKNDQASLDELILLNQKLQLKLKDSFTNYETQLQSNKDFLTLTLKVIKQRFILF